MNLFNPYGTTKFCTAFIPKEYNAIYIFYCMLFYKFCTLKSMGSKHDPPPRKKLGMCMCLGGGWGDSISNASE